MGGSRLLDPKPSGPRGKRPEANSPNSRRRRAGAAGAPGRSTGFRGGGPWGYPGPAGVPLRGLAPNAVLLNRRYADQLGWRNDYDRVMALLGPASGGGEWPFAQAVAYWQMTKGLIPNGVLGVASWTQMQADLPQAPDGAPAGSAPLPLGGRTPLPGAAAAGGVSGDADGDEAGGEELEAYPAPRRLVYCPPPAGFSSTDRIVLAITSRLETGKPFAWPISAEDGISVGLGWNLRSGTLQTLLARFENQTGRLPEFFGADYDRLMSLIAWRHSPEERRRAAAEAISGRLADRWRASMLRLLADPAFSAMLLHGVRGHLSAAKDATRRLGLWTTRGLALLFDIVTRDGLSTAKVERLRRAAPPARKRPTATVRNRQACRDRR